MKISRITLIVEDLEKSANMFKVLFNAQEIYSSDGKKFSISEEKFFLIGKVWFCLMKGDGSNQKTYNHIAFKISKKSYNIYMDKIKDLGLQIKEGRWRLSEEGWSIYFYDYDNHLFELHAGTLNKRLKKYMAEG